VPRVARLLVGNTDHVPDLTYATGLFVPDDFAWFQTVSGKTFALLGPLEIDRARRIGRVDQCLDLSAEEKRIPKGKQTYPKTLANVLRQYGVRSAEIPCTFPIGLAHSLTQAGLKLQSVPEPFFPKRLRKSPSEIRHIMQAIRAAERGLARAIEILKSSKIRRDKVLSWAGSTLTSERLRTEMEITCLRHGSLAKDTIVSGGSQACDPHERGFGPLRAHQAIILDIFPRHIGTGYFGDITRTVVKGQAPEKLRHLRNTVVQGQKRVLKQTRTGAHGLRIQDGLRDWFHDQGYPTQIQKGRWSGFFHGVGHGLGLEIHEAPRFSVPSLPKDTVITVEPGLYVKGIGGVRIEDVVVVQDRGCQRLTRFPDFWEIR
jgi:Xaa-Pro aminopeptidase